MGAPTALCVHSHMEPVSKWSVRPWPRLSFTSLDRDGAQVSIEGAGGMLHTEDFFTVMDRMH
ncbi:unnamed protein product [Staurois parvus]|uniref:Uncharacterized protein n=1 Tax=Staurois parvus TaxID=386267 RepID=A0ABN9FCR8_9NEOB|nr:unnamed protein product [Staurois parvus]